MAFKIFKGDSDIIRVAYFDCVDFMERKNSIDRLLRAVAPIDQLRLLVDVREINLDMSEQEQQEFGQYLASREELKTAKIAVLHKHRNYPDLLIHAFAYASGCPMVPFDDEGEATMWLNNRLK